MKKALFSAILLAAALLADAKVKMPAVFSDNMVLQRETQAALWGTATPGAKVTVKASWTKSTVSTTASSEDGKWFLRVQTPQAGGPYTITVSDGDKLTFSNVLIGEVWFCSGQSNMEMPVKGYPGQPVAGASDVIYSARRSTPIRMCTVKRNASYKEVDDCHAEWQENVPEAVANTSATAYFFAQHIQSALDIPVGLLISDWGGATLESWMSREALEKALPDLDLSFLATGKSKDTPQHTPCLLFNGMVKPVAPYTVKGWIWYQGESNVMRAEQYASLQAAYAGMMRELWGNPEMPFYFVQIAPFLYQGNADKQGGARLMEAQEKSLDMIPFSGMATTADIGEEHCIHPPYKKEVGRRLAMVALKQTYGLPVWGAEAPRFDKAEYQEDGKILLSFKNNDSGLGPVNEDIPGFEVAGDDKVFHPATGRVQKGYQTILVSCPEVSKPVAVRYAFRNYNHGLVRSGNSIALGPFRTDDW